MPKKRTRRRHVPWSFYDSTAHLGSKCGFMRLPFTRDSQGKVHVQWPERRRRGRQVLPMERADREEGYLRQTGSAVLTPAQRRRSRKKLGRAQGSLRGPG